MDIGFNLVRIASKLPQSRIRTTFVRLMFPLWEREFDKKLKRIKYVQRIERQAQIIAGYDGALMGGRDGDEWFDKAFGDLGDFLTGRSQVVYLIQAMFDDEETSKYIKFKLKAFLLWNRIKRFRIKVEF